MNKMIFGVLAGTAGFVVGFIVGYSKMERKIKKHVLSEYAETAKSLRKREQDIDNEVRKKMDEVVQERINKRRDFQMTNDDGAFEATVTDISEEEFEMEGGHKFECKYNLHDGFFYDLTSEFDEDIVEILGYYLFELEDGAYEHGDVLCVKNEDLDICVRVEVIDDEG